MAGRGDAAYRPYVVAQEWRLIEFRGLRYELSAHHSLRIADERAKAARNTCTWLWNNWAPWFVWHVIDRRSGETLRTYQ